MTFSVSTKLEERIQQTESVTALSADIVTPHLGDRLVSGIRWTAWLSVMAILSSFAINVLLARTSREAIGMYGVLSVYVSFVSCFLYIGGDAVIIRFIPRLPNQYRLSFLATYSLSLLVLSLPWILLGHYWPHALTLIFGQEQMPFLSKVFAFSPLYLLLCITGGALRAILDMRWAILLARSVTLGCLIVVAATFWAAPSVLARCYTQLIWCTFLAVAAIATMGGIARVYKQYRADLRQLRPVLPNGFWQYTVATQQVSMLGFWSSRLDSLLILNFAGLSALGQYVSILAVTSAIPTLNGFFLESFLPALAHSLAAGDNAAVASVFNFHKRILFLINATTSLGVMCFASLAIAILGPKYVDLREMLIVAALFTGLSVPLTVGGTLLSCVGRQQQAVWVGLIQSALFASLFVACWHHWALWGTIGAYGISLLIGNTMLMILGERCMPISVSIRREYSALFAILVVCTLVVLQLRGIAAAACWFMALPCFMLMAGYTRQELVCLLRCFLPAWGKQPCPAESA